MTHAVGGFLLTVARQWMTSSTIMGLYIYIYMFVGRCLATNVFIGKLLAT